MLSKIFSVIQNMNCFICTWPYQNSLAFFHDLIVFFMSSLASAFLKNNSRQKSTMNWWHWVRSSRWKFQIWTVFSGLATRQLGWFVQSQCFTLPDSILIIIVTSRLRCWRAAMWQTFYHFHKQLNSVTVTNAVRRQNIHFHWLISKQVTANDVWCQKQKIFTSPAAQNTTAVWWGHSPGHLHITGWLGVASYV